MVLCDRLYIAPRVSTIAQKGVRNTAKTQCPSLIYRIKITTYFTIIVLVCINFCHFPEKLELLPVWYVTLCSAIFDLVIYLFRFFLACRQCAEPIWAYSVDCWNKFPMSKWHTMVIVSVFSIHALLLRKSESKSGKVERRKRNANIEKVVTAHSA